GNNSGSLEHISKNNPSWDEQIDQETKKLKEITNTQKEELKENRTYITKEKISSVERNDNIETLLEQNNNTSTYNEEVIEVDTSNKDVFETSIHNEDNIQTTTHDNKVSETSTSNKNNMETITQNEPRNEQGDSTLERNTTYDVSIINGVGLQGNDITQDEQKGPLSPSIEIDNDKRYSIPKNKNTEVTLPIMEVDNEETPMPSRKKDKDKKEKSLQDKNQLRPSPYRKQHNEGLPSQT
ncbi:2282_t:CDS:2, partial [Cetraspora pellucida]